MSLKPTNKQLIVLDFIKQHIAEKGYPPSRSEIGKHFGVTSNAANCVVHKLVKWGLIELDPHVSRGIRIVDQVAA